MQSAYFIAISLIGGLLFAFFAVGWTSYKDKKIPEKAVIFRWFVAGMVAAGLAAYAYIFGSGGDVGEIVKSVSESLDMDAILKMTAAATEEVTEVAVSAAEEIKVGMPNF
jgi:hypothetical protein